MLVIALWTQVLVGTAGILAASHLGERMGWSGQTRMLLYIGAWAAYGLAIMGLMVVVKRRHARLRAQEGLAEPPCPTIAVGKGRMLWTVLVPSRVLRPALLEVKRPLRPDRLFRLFWMANDRLVRFPENERLLDWLKRYLPDA